MSRLLLLNNNSTTSVIVEQQLPLYVIRMIENHARPLRCVAVGGYPPPIIKVHVDSRDVSSDFKFTTSVSLTSGVRGLRHISVQSERWNNEFDVTADDDDTVIECVAVVPGLKPTVQPVQLHVNCEFLFHSSFLFLLPVRSIRSVSYASYRFLTCTLTTSNNLWLMYMYIIFTARRVYIARTML